ncbi:hypothetical protein SGM_0685 [Streptomyces griseoaurantiacus M045]|uniref:Chaperone protein DnaJ n=1 Tax=Streptomyces griseoaurantiacus M045 TaxID=996637 RepID=F3NBF1_9ACTN|nr:hypothetical protein [Streptomyces griseoaurantiacus]EGG49610.1 hypothetical protein SGM_0685 [Streptomyces griseoaurantiacus M045]
MVTRKTAKTVPAVPEPCPVCKGTGDVPRTVHVGRKRRPVGEQSGICLHCLGTGEAAAEGEE